VAVLKLELPVIKSYKRKSGEMSYYITPNLIACRETTMALYVFSLLGMVVFTFTLGTGNIAVVYFTGTLLGLVQVYMYQWSSQYDGTFSTLGLFAFKTEINMCYSKPVMTKLKQCFIYKYVFT
jgi:hypothetical protein